MTCWGSRAISTARSGCRWTASTCGAASSSTITTSAVHLTTDLSLFDTGFGIAVGGNRALGGGFEDRERWDFTAYYQNSLFKDQPYLTQFRFGWVYYDYPELNNGESLNLQEAHLILSWPNILPVKGLCPSYALVNMWQADSPTRLADGNGWFHILMLDYGFAIPSLIPGLAEEQTIKLHSEVVYNDGVSPTPARRVNDWRISTPIPTTTGPTPSLAPRPTSISVTASP